MVIPVIHNEKKLKAKNKEKEIKKLKDELVVVTNQLNHKTRELEGKEEKESNNYKSTVDKSKRMIGENSVLLANLKKKYIEN